MTLITWGLVLFGTAGVCGVDVYCTDDQQCQAVVVGECSMSLSQCLSSYVELEGDDSEAWWSLGCEASRHPKLIDFDTSEPVRE